VLVVELDVNPGAALARPPGEEGRHEVHERPSQPDEQADGAREIRDREVDAGGILPRLPRDDGLHRELGKSLKPGQDRERQPLRDEELSGLGSPRYEKGGEKDRREGPQRGQRRGFRRDHRCGKRTFHAAGFLHAAGRERGAAAHWVPSGVE
jgi:hypothetical protein